MTDYSIYLTTAATAAGALVASVATYMQSRLTRLRVGTLTTRIEQISRSSLGAVICDYVDIGTLQTLAAQYSVELNPEEIKQTSSGKRVRGVEFGAHGAKASTNHEEQQGMEFLYRVPSDPHRLTERVIDSINRVEDMRTDLARLPQIGVSEISELVKSKATITTDELIDNLIAVAKREQFESAGSRSEFVLIDALWQVSEVDGGINTRLSLAELSTDSDQLTMPGTVSLHLDIPQGNTASAQELVTAQGRQRLRVDAQIRATVFGNAAYFDNRTSALVLTPIAVFNRVGHVRIKN
ncbi:hypothetical protein [Actinoallomurus sp. CA-142502]|uniref:hypothetical protein n=1 Tax=Actinoallomurus sp. CA-142502 TaxID=3239885 RepID=UPI003D8FF664